MSVAPVDAAVSLRMASCWAASSQYRERKSAEPKPVWNVSVATY